jgi:integrase
MANIWTVEQGGDRIKVCWRQRVTRQGEAKREARSVTVTGIKAARTLEVRIREALDVQGWFEMEAPPEQRVANLEKVALAWLAAKRAKGRAAGTLMVLTSGMQRWFNAIRKLREIGADEVVPVSVLSQGLFHEALNLWHPEELSEARLYDLTRYMLDLWRWAEDDPDGWPGVPRAPSDAGRVLADAPVRRDAPPAPTWAEMDAVIRLAPSPEVAHILAMMRATGLRIGQVLGALAGDLDIDRATLRVRVGKSRREKAAQRTVPVSRDLLATLGPRLAACAPADLLFPSPGDPARPRVSPAALVRRLWETSTEAGTARRETWAPERRRSRPDHAFRAGFLSGLARQGVELEVREALAGHAASTTQGRHYAGADALMEPMRAAVDAMPPIDWTGPAGAEGNVVSMRPR